MSTDRHMGGWVFTRPDPRNQDYRMRDRLDLAAPAVTREWTPGPVRDQGQTPHCVAFGSNDWLACDPIVNPAIDPDELYAACQAVDGIVGPHDGTTVHAAMKVLKARGLVTEYLWAYSEVEVRAWVSQRSPVVIGIDWYEGMFTPTKRGYLHRTGALAGGHCVLLCGYDARRHAYRVQNSWGPGWSLGGFAWLRVTDLAALMADGGEVATAVEVGSA